MVLRAEETKRREDLQRMEPSSNEQIAAVEALSAAEANLMNVERRRVEMEEAAQLLSSAYFQRLEAPQPSAPMEYPSLEPSRAASVPTSFNGEILAAPPSYGESLQYLHTEREQREEAPRSPQMSPSERILQEREVRRRSATLPGNQTLIKAVVTSCDSVTSLFYSGGCRALSTWGPILNFPHTFLDSYDPLAIEGGGSRMDQILRVK